MSMERYDPFREMMTMRDMMNRFFNDSFFRSPFETTSTGGQNTPLAIDVHEDEQGYTLTASLPGFKPEDINITVNGNSVTLRAQSNNQQERKQGNYLVRERQSGSFQRTITLPEQIQTDKSEARFEHGELILSLPRVQGSRSRQIPVTAGQSGKPQITQGATASTAQNTTSQSTDTGATAATGSPQQ